MKSNKSKKEFRDAYEFELKNGPESLQFQPEKYRDHLDETGWNDPEKDEYLKLLWDMMSTSVDIEWGIDPTQTALPSVGDQFAKYISGISSAKNKPHRNQNCGSQSEAVKLKHPPKKARTKRGSDVTE